jgi:hypothetical protein
MTEFIPPAKPIVGDDEIAAVSRVIRSGMLAQGPEVKAFEEEFAAHISGWGARCVAVNSGTCRAAFGVAGQRRWRAGDEVIVPVVHLRRDSQLGGTDRRDSGLRRHRAGHLLPGPGVGGGRR